MVVDCGRAGVEARLWWSLQADDLVGTVAMVITWMADGG